MVHTLKGQIFDVVEVTNLLLVSKIPTEKKEYISSSSMNQQFIMWNTFLSAIDIFRSKNSIQSYKELYIMKLPLIGVNMRPCWNRSKPRVVFHISYFTIWTWYYYYHRRQNWHNLFL